MDMNSENRILKDLTASEWISCLQKHFLHINDANENHPIEWLDATPEELALAVGCPDAKQEEIISAFMKLFSRKAVRRVLGKKVSKHQGKFAYDNFHFLVLSCFVVAAPIYAGDNRDFRDRLGKLLCDDQGREQSVWGLNSLWEALTEWANKDPSLRTISLPNPGKYSNIGFALKLAYPSWEDLSALKIILKKGLSKDFQSRYALVQHIYSHRYDLPESSQHRIAAHLNELVDRFTNGKSVESHPFWRIIERVLGDLEKTKTSSTNILLWRLSMDFYSSNERGVDVLIATGNCREQLRRPCWEGAFEQLLSSQKQSYIPIQIQQMLNNGTILLFESPDGLWSQDDRLITNETCIIITNIKTSFNEFQKPLELACSWFASEPMDYDKAKSLTFGEGLAIDQNVATKEFSLEGGVKVRRKYWLGRPGYLPYMCLPHAVQIDSLSGLEIQLHNDIACISTDKALDGQFDIQIRSDNFNKSVALNFLSNAEKNTSWPQRPMQGFDGSQEVFFEEGRLLSNGLLPIHTSSKSLRLLDALEAIYAKAGSSRSEREIINLLRPVLAKETNPWDILRSLEEAGWLQQDVSKTWRGRRWRALPPKIVKTSHYNAIIEGATGAVELELLEAEANRLGINYFFNAEHPWSVPIVGLSGENLDLLAESVNWPVIHARQPVIKPAPNCWLKDSRTPQGRKLASVWNSETGRFESKESLSTVEQIQLIRFVRDDSQDLYCITEKGQQIFSTSERLVALLELARKKATSLFVKHNEQLIRQADFGYLPLCLAQWLRRSNARQTGLREVGDRFNYGYDLTAVQMKNLQHVLGLAIGTEKKLKENDLIQLFANNRQRRMRSHWSYDRGQG